MLVSKDKLAGTIIGQCVGDATGFPVEGRGEEICRMFVEKYVLDEKHPPSSGHFSDFGQYTDDSQLARELLINLAKNNGLNPEEYAEQIVHLFSNNLVVGRGMATDSAFRRLWSGISWKESGEPAPSAGNGTAMRAAPIGMFYFDDREALIDNAGLQGIITHKDDRCHAGSVIIAAGVAYGLTHNNLDTREFIDNIVELVEPISDIFGRELSRMHEFLQMPFRDSLFTIALSGKPDMRSGWDKISPYVIPSVLWSVYSFLRTPNNYLETLRSAIRCGGDVDTTAAMAGALSGAFNGLSKIPQIYVSSINDQGTWYASDLFKLVDDCYNLIELR